MSDSLSDLRRQHCVPCEGGVEPLSRTEFEVYLPQVKEWEITNGDKQIEKEFLFKNFKEVIAFINQIAEVAEEEGHHPNLFVHEYKNLRVSLYTHAIGGLSINDFVLATKIDSLLPKSI